MLFPNRGAAMRTCISVTAVSLLLVVRAAAATGTFVDRFAPSDVRIVSYNIGNDSIFPSVDATLAAKFERVVNALDPDILNLQEIYNHSAADVVNLMNGIAPLSGGGSWQAQQGFDNVIVSRFPLTMKRTEPVPAGDREVAIALVDLPDAEYGVDFYVMNNHYKCCGSGDPQRQRQSDALVNWMRDARSPGGSVDLPEGTPMFVLGDLNIVGGPDPLDTLLTGDIADESTYGADSPPDWDGTTLVDAHPLHNGTGPDDYTWRNDFSVFDPGRLDFVLYTDSVVDLQNRFLLNTVAMSGQELAATGLAEFDIVQDDIPAVFDHLPVVADFRLPAPGPITGDMDWDGDVDFDDIDDFVLGLNNPQAYQDQYGAPPTVTGDTDGDSDLDFDDIGPFVEILTPPQGSDSQTVPEPSTLALALLGLIGLAGRARNKSALNPQEVAGQ